MEILKQFGINPILLLAQVVNFALLLFILKRFLYKPILKVLEERKKKIEDSLKNAEEIEKKLLETDEKIGKMMGKASDDIQQMMDEVKKERAMHLEETKVLAGKMHDDIIQKANEEAKVNAVKLEQAVMAKVADIVALGMEKVTGKLLSAKDKKDIIEKEVRNLS
ncbi:F0F1 ATP synthase subunit B [Candidatus Daviesbacteria bacterium]|nr:F0F1 ATP synthase subunit B [Candidatus Daviesbacteria bacterium]